MARWSFLTLSRYFAHTRLKGRKIEKLPFFKISSLSFLVGRSYEVLLLKLKCLSFMASAGVLSCVVLCKLKAAYTFEYQIC